MNAESRAHAHADIHRPGYALEHEARVRAAALARKVGDRVTDWRAVKQGLEARDGLPHSIRLDEAIQSTAKH